MSVQNVKKKFISMLGTTGKAGLHTLFPNDFELYLIAIELVNSRNATEELFVFPINPRAIRRSEDSYTLIKRSAGGIVTTDSNNFNPIDINIEGNFGRSFKLLIGGQDLFFSGVRFFRGNGELEAPVFDAKIKTGFGCYKLFEKILQRSRKIDQFGGAYKLYFYNSIFGEEYLVKYKQFTGHMDVNENFIHNYNASFTAVAPLKGLVGYDQRQKTNVIGYGVIQKEVNKLVGNIKRLLYNSNKPNDRFEDFASKVPSGIMEVVDDFVTLVDGGDSDDSVFFDGVARLNDRYRQSMASIEANPEIFNNYKYWELYDVVAEIGVKIRSISNKNRWQGKIELNGRDNSAQVEYTLGQNQLPEAAIRDMTLNDNVEADWNNVLIKNRLREEDYTPEGGVPLKIELTGNNPLYIESVIDIIDTGEKTYGKDIQKKIEFIDEDLAVLTYKPTLIQTVDILANLRKGDNPFIPGIGLDQNLVAGSTYSAIAYSSIYRQLAETFGTDDSLKSFQLRKVGTIQDALNIEYSVETRFGEVLNQTSNVQK